MKKLIFLFLLPIITFAQKETVIMIKTDTYPSETRWVMYADSCLLYTSPSPRDAHESRMPSSA